MTSPRRSGGEASSPSPIKAAESAAASVHPRSAGGAGDANGVATASNESLMWELLYNLEWQMPMAELEKLWTDALGESGAHPTSHQNTCVVSQQFACKWKRLCFEHCFLLHAVTLSGRALEGAAHLLSKIAYCAPVIC